MVEHVEYATGAVRDRRYLVSEIDEEVSRMSNIIDQLEKEFSPVLSPVYQDEKGDASSSPAPVQSYIQDTHGRLRYQVDRLVKLVDRALA